MNAADWFPAQELSQKGLDWEPHPSESPRTWEYLRAWNQRSRYHEGSPTYQQVHEYLAELWEDLTDQEQAYVQRECEAYSVQAALVCQVRKLSPKPGDILVLQTACANQEAVEGFVDFLRGLEFDGVAAVVLSADLRLELLSSEALAELGLQRIPKS